MARLLLLLGALAMLLDFVWLGAVVRANVGAPIFIPVYTLFLAVPLWMAGWVAHGMRDVTKDQAGPPGIGTSQTTLPNSFIDRSRALGLISLLCASASVVIALVTGSVIVRGLAVTALLAAAAALLDPRRSLVGRRLAVSGLAAGCIGLYAARLAVYSYQVHWPEAPAVQGGLRRVLRQRIPRGCPREGVARTARVRGPARATALSPVTPVERCWWGPQPGYVGSVPRPRPVQVRPLAS